MVLAVPGVKSALDAGAIADSREVAATGVFEPVIDGQRLTLPPDGDQFVDRETGSRWDILGRAREGPLTGKQLPAVVHVDTFWFAWAAFAPRTTVIG